MCARFGAKIQTAMGLKKMGRQHFSDICYLASTKQCRVIQRVRPDCRYRMVQVRPSEVTMA